MTVTDLELVSSEDVIRTVGNNLNYGVLIRWVTNGAVEPTHRATGSGRNHGWSPRDIAALRAITQVRHDLATIGLPCPRPLVAELWEQLIVNGVAFLTTGTVTISVRRGLEGQ